MLSNVCLWPPPALPLSGIREYSLRLGIVPTGSAQEAVGLFRCNKTNCAQSEATDEQNHRLASGCNFKHTNVRTVWLCLRKQAQRDYFPRTCLGLCREDTLAL